MSTKVVSIKLDEDIKERAQEVAKSAGLTLSSLINSYLHQIVATRRIELYAPEPMTPHLEKLIAEIEAELARGEAIGPFNSAEEMIAKLHEKPE
jgi:addiction module RelB/DinJ family antitoxin